MTATLANAAANSVWGNNTNTSAAPGYQTSINLSGGASFGSSSSVAGIAAMQPGATTLSGYSSPSLPANFVGWQAPATVTGQHAFQTPAVGSAGGQTLVCAAESTSISQCAWQTLSHSVKFVLSNGGSSIATGATNLYAESEAPSTVGIYKVVITGTATSGPATCSIAVDVWKANAAIPTSGGLISASAPAALSSAQYASNTTLTGWTTTVAAGDVWSLSVESSPSPTCVSATVEIWWK
jgi:hypothetical protein